MKVVNLGRWTLTQIWLRLEKAFGWGDGTKKHFKINFCKKLTTPCHGLDSSSCWQSIFVCSQVPLNPNRQMKIWKISCLQQHHPLVSGYQLIKIQLCLLSHMLTALHLRKWVSLPLLLCNKQHTNQPNVSKERRWKEYKWVFQTDCQLLALW